MASNPQHEPTMEEILASIRKIISEDSAETPAAAPAAAAAPATEPDDVLELTQELREEPAPVQAAAAPTVVLAPIPVQPAPKPVDDVVFQTEEAVVSSTPAPSSEIFSDKTRKAIDDAFANLDAPDEPPARAPARAAASMPAVDGDSVEAVFERAVRDAVGPHIDQWMAGQKDELLNSVKPLIREWMDEHFPALLEGAVRDEVARAVKARGKR